MAPDRKTLIGKVLQTVRYTIRAEDIQDYMPVAGEDHQAFSSDEGARAVGYERRVVPPSFAPFVAVVALLRSFDWKRDFFLDYKTGTAMFGEQEIEYLRPLYVGETLTVHATVTDVYEKQGKRPFDVAQVNFAAMDEGGTVAFQGMQSYIIFK
jgi:acyl dehydratase